MRPPCHGRDYLNSVNVVLTYVLCRFVPPFVFFASSVCYDTKVQDHCKLLDIREDCGAVEVCYANDPDVELIISPDNLVHDPHVQWEECMMTKPSPKTITNRSSPSKTSTKNPAPPPTLTRTARVSVPQPSRSERHPSLVTDVETNQEDQSGLQLSEWDDLLDPPENEGDMQLVDISDNKPYFGVFVHNDVNCQEQWYIRGKLLDRGDDEDPLLLYGESVEYTCASDVAVKYLQWNHKKGSHDELVSNKDIARCKDFALKGERCYAAKRRIDDGSANTRRQAAFQGSFRPRQPVYVDGVGEATVIDPPDSYGFSKVEMLNNGAIRTEAGFKLRWIDYKPEPIDLDGFFRSVKEELPSQKGSYKNEPSFLYDEWKAKNKELADEFEDYFDAEVKERRRKRKRGCGGEGDGSVLTSAGEERLKKRARLLLSRLQEDFYDEPCNTQMIATEFKARIVDVKKTLPNPNFLLLCGGIAPEITAYKRLLAAPIGAVILQDTDLLAVGVAVAAHPDVHFYIVCDNPNKKKPKPPGDVRILSENQSMIRAIEIKLGGIHFVVLTTPCQSFSLAGRKDGFLAESGKLMEDCFRIVRGIEASSNMPIYMAENVPSTEESNSTADSRVPHVGARFFYADGAMCSASLRRRKFATNRPPPKRCSEEPHPRGTGHPPCLNGDLPEVCAGSVVSQEQGGRFVHPELKKFPCFMRSNPLRNSLVYIHENKFNNPEPTPLLPEEVERAMGYTEDEIGITAYTAKAAIEQRLKDHNYERDGCLVSLKGCGSDVNFPPEPVEDMQRLELLGNSQCVTLLEALMWNDQELFPPVQKKGSHEDDLILVSER